MNDETLELLFDAVHWGISRDRMKSPGAAYSASAKGSDWAAKRHGSALALLPADLQQEALARVREGRPVELPF